MYLCGTDLNNAKPFFIDLTLLFICINLQNLKTTVYLNKQLNICINKPINKYVNKKINAFVDVHLCLKINL